MYFGLKRFKVKPKIWSWEWEEWKWNSMPPLMVVAQMCWRLTSQFNNMNIHIHIYIIKLPISSKIVLFTAAKDFSTKTFPQTPYLHWIYEGSIDWVKRNGGMGSGASLPRRLDVDDVGNGVPLLMGGGPHNCTELYRIHTINIESLCQAFYILIVWFRLSQLFSFHGWHKQVIFRELKERKRIIYYRDK